MIVEKVIQILTSYFDHVIVAIQEPNNFETLKYEDLVGSLEAHEMIVEQKAVQDSTQELHTQAQKKQAGSNKFKGKGDKNKDKKSWSNPQKHKVDDRASESSTRGGGNSYSKENVKMGKQCNIYDKWGHSAKNCWYRKDKGEAKGKEEGGNLAQHDFNDMVVMVAVADDHVDSKIWFLDTGCLNHMIGRKVWLADFNDLKKSKVKHADNSSIGAEGTRNILIQRDNDAYRLFNPINKKIIMSCDIVIDKNSFWNWNSDDTIDE